MTKSDKELITQMIRAGHFNGTYDLLRQKVEHDSKEMIKQMGTKWCCHPSHSPQKGNYGI